MAEQLEPEVLDARRAFAAAQTLLAGEPLNPVGLEIGVGWHDTSTHPETGAFAVVASESVYEEWIGEVLLVTANSRSCYVYVMASADVPTSLSLARRAFAALGELSTEEVDAVVQVVQ